MLLGGLWRLNERYVWMAMRGYSVETAYPTLERKFWDLFPSQTLRFWPLFLRESHDIGVFLEKTLPIRVYTRMTGLGTFSTRIVLLSPRLVVEWRGQKWCVSLEGQMWNAADGNAWIKELEIPQKPVWRIVSLPGMSSADKRPLPSGIFPALFSTAAIEDFLTSFGDSPWFGNIEEVVLDRREGSDLFTLRFVRESQELTILIQKEKYGWQELDFALEHILGRLWKEGGNHVVDATYKDKIVVKKLIAGAGEGGSK